MEQSYLLARDETVLSLDAAFRWETCADRARYFWCGVLCAYSAARLGETEKVRQMADRVLESETSELPQPDLAAACLLDVLFLAGRFDKLKQQHERHAQDAACVSSPLLIRMREKKECPPPEKLAPEIIAAFTPRRLLPHLAW